MSKTRLKLQKVYSLPLKPSNGQDVPENFEPRIKIAIIKERKEANAIEGAYCSINNGKEYYWAQLSV